MHEAVLKVGKVFLAGRARPHRFSLGEACSSALALADRRRGACMPHWLLLSQGGGPVPSPRAESTLSREPSSFLLFFFRMTSSLLTSNLS